MLNYQNRQNNESTFETLSEVCAHAPKATENLSGNSFMPRTADPALKDFPEGRVFIYRSANLYGGETAARNNTTFVLFSDRRFEERETALESLRALGLIEEIDRIIGTIILIMPEKDTGYGENDLQSTYVLMKSLMTPRASVEIDGVKCCPAENEYCGGYGKVSFFGIHAGATFMNNFIAGAREELSGRAVGFFTYGGEMSDEALVTVPMPAFLVNPSPAAVRAYREVNGCDAYAECDGIRRFRNQALPLREVRTAKDEGNDPGPWMLRAYREMFRFLQRTVNVPSKSFEPAVTNPYQGYVKAPAIPQYALSRRNPVENDRTVIGDLQVLFIHDTERFSDLKLSIDKIDKKYINFLANDNDYLDAWYEILPQEVLQNTAPAHSVPLLMANHGGGDDPLMYLDETGILLTAGENHFAIAAGMHSGLTFVGVDIVGEAFSRLAKYMLEKYPALDPERVYVTGYSMGGAATYSCIGTHPEIYAAAVPMAMPLFGLPEGTEERYETCEMPVMLLSSTNDFAAWDPMNNHLNEGAQLFFRSYQKLNGMQVPETFDFENYPFIGQAFSSMEVTVENGEWRNFAWMLPSPKPYPLMGLHVVEYLLHSLWPGYGDIAWDFLKHYRRDAETGEIIYTS